MRKKDQRTVEGERIQTRKQRECEGGGKQKEKHQFTQEMGKWNEYEGGGKNEDKMA